MIVTLSLSLRVAVNAEALNMAEAVGNYTRHRKAPVVITSEAGYSVVYVPAVSGESLAHAYQQLLAQIAKQRNLPVTKLDEMGYFLKFTSDKIMDWYKEDLEKVNSKYAEILSSRNVEEIERLLVKASVVADVGGLLYTEKQVKRTSAIRFSYMLPTLDAVEKGGVALTPQLHTRYVHPKMPREMQMLFY